MTRARILPAVVVVAVGALVTACGGSDDGALQADEGYSVAGSLGELPAELGDEVYISSADLDAVCEANGCQRPDSADDEGAQEWVSALTGTANGSDAVVYAPLPQALFTQSRQLAEVSDQLGWSLVDVDSYVGFDVMPEPFTVVSGDAELSDDLIELDGGVVTTSEGEDGMMNPSESSPVDEMGRPIRLAQEGDRIAMSLGTPPVEAWIDGPQETLADNDGLNAVATALDDADVVSAVLSNNTAMSSNSGGGSAGDPAAESTVAPFDFVGIGWSPDGDAGTATVAYHHASTDDAEANVDAIQSMFDESTPTANGQPLSDLYTLDDVSAEDSVSTATLRLTDEAHPENVLQMLQSGDVLFAAS